jgi:hypothetical protein
MRGMNDDGCKQLARMLSLLGINMKSVEALRTAPHPEEEKEAEATARFKNVCHEGKFCQKGAQSCIIEEDGAVWENPSD